MIYLCQSDLGLVYSNKDTISIVNFFIFIKFINNISKIKS